MESIIKYTNNSQHLYGVLHQPDEQESETLIIFLHGWGTYRIGPHRIFVEAARSFTKAGFACLRFDFRGRGESEGNLKEIKLVDMISDAEATVQYMLAKYDYKSIVLLGLCSGGEVAIGSALCNPAIKGLILWSTPVLGRQTNLKNNINKTADHAKSYGSKLLNPDTWKKIIRFQVNYKAVLHVLFGHFKNKPEKLPLEQERLEAYQSFQGKSLFIYAGNDPEAPDSQTTYQEICKKHSINSVFHTIPEANHNFYSLSWKKELINKTQDWLQTLNS